MFSKFCCTSQLLSLYQNAPDCNPILEIYSQSGFCWHLSSGTHNTHSHDKPKLDNPDDEIPAIRCISFHIMYFWSTFHNLAFPLLNAMQILYLLTPSLSSNLIFRSQKSHHHPFSLSSARALGLSERRCHSPQCLLSFPHHHRQPRQSSWAHIRLRVPHQA